MNVLKAYFLVVLLWAPNTQALNREAVVATCVRALPITNPMVRGFCCQLQNHTFTKYWYFGGFYLTRHLEMLKVWKCPQMVNECKNRPSASSEFANLTYDYFCNRRSLAQKCLPTLQSGPHYDPITRNTSYQDVREDKTNVSDVSKWSQMVENIDFSNLNARQVSEPCFQVAQFAAPSGGFGEFHEVLSTKIPFCKMTWCGFSTTVVQNGARPYDCLPTVCRANVIILVIAVIALSVMIVVVNVLVLAVFITTKTLQNSQAIYKCSLATADLLIGIFALPSFAVNLYRMTWRNIEIGELLTLKNLELARPFIDWNQTLPGRDGFTIRKSTGSSASIFDPQFGTAAGVLTAISLMVSIYTLSMAGFDRLLAVYKPLRYRRHVARKTAVWATIVIWIVAIVFALVPIMTDLEYAVSTAVYVVYGANAEIFYIVLFAIPIVIVWVTNILTLAIVRKKNRNRRRLTNTANKTSHERNIDQRLAVTLMIIVCVFTACCLPTFAISVSFLNFKMDNKDFNPDRDYIFNSIDAVAGIILMSNSLWNYFIYSGRNKDFKKASSTLRNKIASSFRISRVAAQQKGEQPFSTDNAGNSVATIKTMYRDRDSRYHQRNLVTSPGKRQTSVEVAPAGHQDLLIIPQKQNFLTSNGNDVSSSVSELSKKTTRLNIEDTDPGVVNTVLDGEKSEAVEITESKNGEI